MEKTRKGRDNFTQAVLKILYRRAGGKCCRCGAATFGPVQNHPLQSVNIGKGAHIAAAAAGGPRYSPTMTADERSSATNGMWLCSNCHDTIDRDPATYPTPALKQMKKDAEDRIRKELGVATIQPSSSAGSQQLITSLSAGAILEVRKSKAKFLESWSQEEDEGYADSALGDIAFLDFEQDEYSKEVAMEVLIMLREITIRCTVAFIGLEVIRRLESIADCFNSTWDREEMNLVCNLVGKLIRDSRQKRSKVYQSGMALLKDLSSYTVVKKNGLNKIPLDTIKKLRGGKDEIDAPSSKRIRTDDDNDEKYHQLMEELATSNDPTQILNIEDEIESMGFEPRIQ